MTHLVQGQRVLVREMVNADAPALVAWRGAPDARRWLVDWQPPTVERHLAWFASAQQAGDVLLVFAEPGTNRPLAAGALYHFDRAGTCGEYGRLIKDPQVSDWLIPREGLYWTYRLAFDLLGVARLHTATGDGNQAVHRLAEEFGFLREGLRPRHFLTPEGYRDIVEFGMFPETFGACRPALEQALYAPGTPPEFLPDAARYADRWRARFGR